MSETPETPEARDENGRMELTADVIETAAKAIVREGFRQLGYEDVSDEEVQGGFDAGLADGDDYRADARAALVAALPGLREAWAAEALAATQWQASNSGEWFCLACDDWVDECEAGDCAMGKVRALLSSPPHDTPAVVEGRVG